ncbi:MAG: molybdopterin and thiamine biosynthesis family dinucleotide-utilizing protein [Acidobacteria bacterium OLB17]|nr:MAG: molybdopterin and thiamine biosynthesis family dinucleotide-utilizing protein [Acidobacteria bacterium OLB17]MCZ2391338.1 ThiF family adenylyltransferase [Acidobacteriota bacterium]
MDERYSRQILFGPIGAAGQQKLLDARVLLVGVGALGCAQAEMLARAGVGKIRLVDRDFVETTNLQRQTLYSEDDALERLPKAVAAKKRLLQINSGVEIEEIVADVTNSNIEQLISGCGLVLDGTDNFRIRYLINDACVKAGIPWIYGAAVSSYGMTMNVIPGETPCLRCIFPEMPDPGSAPTCDTAGVIAPVVMRVAAMQAAEAFKFLVGDRASLSSKLRQFDVWTNDGKTIGTGSPDPNCRTCGKREFEFLDADTVEFAAVLCGRNAVQIAPDRGGKLDLDALADRLKFNFSVNQNEYLLRFSPEDCEVTVFSDGRAIIKGIDDTAAARSLYAKYIGN